MDETAKKPTVLRLTAKTDSNQRFPARIYDRGYFGNSPKRLPDVPTRAWGDDGLAPAALAASQAAGPRLRH